jgi:transcriptional regulator with XRE-family HTH domain
MEGLMPTLRELRTAKGWTLQRLAEEVGVKEMTAARWEWAKPHGFEPSAPAKLLLARIFRIKVGEIAFNTEISPRATTTLPPDCD